MKNLIKDTDYKYLIASLFISTIYGFSEIFKSEINPNKKNNNVKILMFISICKNIIEINNTTPPIKGTFDLEMNIGCLSPV